MINLTFRSWKILIIPEACRTGASISDDTIQKSNIACGPILTWTRHGCLKSACRPCQSVGTSADEWAALVDTYAAVVARIWRTRIASSCHRVTVSACYTCIAMTFVLTCCDYFTSTVTAFIWLAHCSQCLALHQMVRSAFL